MTSRPIPDPVPVLRRARGRGLGVLAVMASLALGAAACGSDDDSSGTDSVATGEAPDPSAESTDASITTEGAATTDAPEPSEGSDVTITLVTYDSFPESETSLNDALASFTEQSGIEVDLLIAGDTGTMLSKAALTAGNPEGDVMWGIDNTFLSRAVNDEIFEPYLADGIESVPAEFTDLVSDGIATPVDYGDVCVNFDIAGLAEREIEPPTTFDDLVDPTYADMLVVENPATSSPGLAFLLATIDEYGADGWQDYWTALNDNGVEVVDSWSQAYYERFSWAGGGPRPLVVSYGSSPPAEVIFADPPRDDSPTGVVESTCFRQVEFAGILRGTDAPDEAQQLIDFLIGEEFQAELALNLFVYPSNESTELPQEFIDFAVVPDASRTLDPAEIDANRSAWIDEWTELVLG